MLPGCFPGEMVAKRVPANPLKSGAPRPMKMGNIASLWRYDAAALSHARTREYATASDLGAAPMGAFSDGTVEFMSLYGRHADPCWEAMRRPFLRVDRKLNAGRQNDANDPKRSLAA